jgi:hypothetical protein
MQIKIKTTISIVDDNGNTIKFENNEQFQAKLKKMHEEFKKDIRQAVDNELDPHHGFDYDKAMGVVR